MTRPIVTNYGLNVSACDVPPIPDTGDSNLRRGRSVSRAKGKLPFVVWDGEGANVEGMIKQSYVLLGCFDGEEHHMIKPEHSDYARLTTMECLRFITQMGERYVNAWHVSFAFGYDAAMILSDLSAAHLRRLHKFNSCWFGPYRIEYYPGKWLRVTKRRKEEKNITITIEDAFGFFQCSLVKALKANLAGHPLMENLPEIEAGKDRRDKFTSKDFSFIVKYWKIENQLFHALMERLYGNMYDERVDLKIRKWYGPGALASYVYKTRGILAHKADCGPEIYDCARYAYAGGRFEMFHIGRFTNVYGYDINSAYPYAISQLPSLANGHWKHVDNPEKIARFGVYRVRITRPMKGAMHPEPSPLYHRDSNGNISFPWHTEGWYWSPEVTEAIATFDEIKNTRMYRDMVSDPRVKMPVPKCDVIEGWEFVEHDPTLRPFAFVLDMYAQRKRLKAEGEGAQMALKLALNSLYGKMAQRAGWERRNGPPTWHQLEWAGWVTSKTRATLHELMRRIGYDRLIAVETDGLYTTATPEELGIEDSKELGGWEVSHFDEMVYYQSGIYVKEENGERTSKYRGLDPKSVPIADLYDHVYKLEPLPREGEWEPIVGTNTRFVGIGSAVHRGGDDDKSVKRNIARWETKEAVISVGEIGKRTHKPGRCTQCRNGIPAYVEPHPMAINSMALCNVPGAEQSKRHDIPWLDQETPLWREMQDENVEMIMEAFT